MQTTAIITQVKTVFNTTKPVVVFELSNGQTIFRYPKQALIDLQNSGRALEIPQNALDRGLSALDQANRATFQSALLECTNAQLTGVIISHKAGDTYVIDATHPSITDKNHPDYGTAKVGDTKVSEKDGNRIDGFLFIPLTEADKMRRDVSKNIATAMLQMYGFGGMSAPVAIVPQTTGVIDTTLGTPEEAFEDLPVVDTTAKAAGVK